MIVRPMEFGMIQQQNTVSHVRPMVEQQTTAVQLQKDIHTRAEQVNHKEDPNNRQKKFDAKDKSDNEYQSGHKERKNQTSEDGKVFIKDLEDIDFDVKV